ncbi:Tetratricopeptide repeat (TPR)-like superfamily protein isoform 1 [Hibiscus syriacus]|uniref:Tetratricopeptide repeat (TPR)-like superfamily protein isoform 1 n=1 Tax=Hibiscus syriacus TaxID=106335 RepID=A0A6A2Y5F9_HIBSY|nr:Tetratricopeptide repeat (TPR)-like superfamily protein isoform 1 [Hibiscus syriacus]
MAKRRAKKAVKEVPAPVECGVEVNDKEGQNKEKRFGLMDQEVEQQCAAIRAVRDVEIDHLLTALRLLRSYFSEEQLQTPALQFFNENLPNLPVVRNAENGQFEVQWKHEDGNLSIHDADGGDIHACLLHRMSLVYANHPSIPSYGGFELSTEAARMSLLRADSQQNKDFILEGTSESQMFGMHEALQTPGVTSQRLSVGMTPKTKRLPKPGEILLSVHGSPLGVYKEDNMEAIYGIILVLFSLVFIIFKVNIQLKMQSLMRVDWLQIYATLAINFKGP